MSVLVVASVSVLVMASTNGFKWIALFSDELMCLVVLGRYEPCSYLGTPPGITVYDPWHGFPYVLYRLWPIGLAASHLEVITRRCITRITWLWPGGMN